MLCVVFLDRGLLCSFLKSTPKRFRGNYKRYCEGAAEFYFVTVEGRGELCCVLLTDVAKLKQSLDNMLAVLKDLESLNRHHVLFVLKHANSPTYVTKVRQGPKVLDVAQEGHSLVRSWFYYGKFEQASKTCTDPVAYACLKAAYGDNLDHGPTCCLGALLQHEDNMTAGKTMVLKMFDDTTEHYDDSLIQDQLTPVTLDHVRRGPPRKREPPKSKKRAWEDGPARRKRRKKLKDVEATFATLEKQLKSLRECI